MSHIFEPTLSLSQLKLPPQDIGVLSFCESNKPLKVRQWADNLKTTQIRATAIELYKAIPEINHLNVDAKSRFEMLEILWPAVQECLQGLVKEFLHQPLVVPDNVQNVALMAQALQKHLAEGYILCVKALVSESKLKPALQDLLLSSIFRALTASGMLLLRSSQLYLASPPQLWQRVHALYQTAEFYQLHHRPLPGDDGRTGRTITHAYAQIVVFSSIRPNQLSQNELFQAYRALEAWVRHVKFLPSVTDNPNNLFIIDLDQDNGAIVKARFDGPPEHRLLELDLNALVSLLSKISGSKSERAAAPVGTGTSLELHPSLLDNILDGWINATQRSNDRKRSDMAAEACFGLIDCHFNLCGGIEFEEFIRPQESNRDESFLSGGFEALLGSLTKKNEPEAPKPTKQTEFSVTIQNNSAGGYCVSWEGGLPTRVEAGELIGIREQGRRVWSIGIIRWIRQLKNNSLLGIQLLSSQPVPFAASVRYDMGGFSDYMRAIHIPRPIPPNYPPSILTAAVPFQIGSQVRLKQEDTVTDVRLTQSHISNSKLKLFSFNVLNENNDR
jgi:cyclic-di-GMP-binding protein